MKTVIDTSVLVRYFTQDPPELGEAATLLLDGQPEVTIGLVALAETGYVLMHHYTVPRDEVVDTLVAWLRRHNVRVAGVDRAIVADSLSLCKGSGRVSLADALILAEARSRGCDKVWTFDSRFPSVGVTARPPTLPCTPPSG